MQIENNSAFWAALDKLTAQSEAVIDRPKGSVHPTWPDMVYPLDYGYLAQTTSPDGEGIDLWRGSDAARGLTAFMVTVDLCKRDSEIKLLIGCTEEEIRTVDHFYNDYDTIKALLIRREERK